MHYIQLVDSIVILSTSPTTIHKLHPYYHKLKQSTSLQEAEAILSVPFTEVYYLLPSGVLVTSLAPGEYTGPIAAFTSPQEARLTYPELFL